MSRLITLLIAKWAQYRMYKTLIITTQRSKVLQFRIYYSMQYCRIYRDIICTYTVFKPVLNIEYTDSAGLDSSFGLNWNQYSLTWLKFCIETFLILNDKGMCIL